MFGYPFMFVRRRRVTKENGLKANGIGTKFRVTHVVMLTSSWDLVHYNSSWMDDPVLGDSRTDDDLVTVPDVDLVDDHNVFVFDSDDSMQNEFDALNKMKELWAALSVPEI